MIVDCSIKFKKNSNIVQYLKTNIFGSYYDRNMLEKYQQQTIKSMFYELDQIKWKNFEKVSDYLNSVILGLTNFFRTSDYHACEDNVILFSCLIINLCLFFFQIREL